MCPRNSLTEGNIHDAFSLIQNATDKHRLSEKIGQLGQNLQWQQW